MVTQSFSRFQSMEANNFLLFPLFVFIGQLLRPFSMLLSKRVVERQISGQSVRNAQRDLGRVSRPRPKAAHDLSQ